MVQAGADSDVASSDSDVVTDSDVVSLHAASENDLATVQVEA